MRRKGHPSFPSCDDLLFFLFAQDIAHAEEPIRAPVGVNVPGFLVGRFWVTPEGGGESATAIYSLIGTVKLRVICETCYHVSRSTQ